MTDAVDLLPDKLREQITVLDTGCWHWNGGRKTSGRGRVHHGGREWAAHRLVWTLLMPDPLPPNSDLLHNFHDDDCPAAELGGACRHQLCCNPAHHRIGRRGRRGSVGGAVNAARTTCGRCGRDYDYVDQRGWRKCTRCQRERQRERLAAAARVSR